MALSPRESENAWSETSARAFSTALPIKRETVQVQSIKEERKETNRGDLSTLFARQKMKVHGYSPEIGLA